MPQPKNVFVTGATGFLGSHLSLELLQKGYRVRALARGSSTASPQQRVEETLRDAAGSTELLQPLMERLEVIEGDMSRPGLGMTDEIQRRLLASTDGVWHCAASLSFAEEDRDEIFQMNVVGTEHLLRLVERLPSRRLHHVSTAYIAGNRPDVAMETDIDVGQTFKNPYEESKCRSELLVADAHLRKAVRASVYRPSIVVGDSRTGRITHFHGVYAFIRALWTTLERVRRQTRGNGVIHFPLRVPGSRSGTLNFVPIDYVTNAMTWIGSRESSLGKTYHLTNPEPTPNTWWLPSISRILGVEGVEIVGQEGFATRPMTKLELLFRKQLAFYYMYLQGEPRFDCRQTRQALEGSGIECPHVTDALMEKMVGWYLDYLNRSKNAT